MAIRPKLPGIDFLKGAFKSIRGAVEPLSRGLAALDPYSRRLRREADETRLRASQSLIKAASQQADFEKKQRLLNLAREISSQPTAAETFAKTLPTRKQVITSGLKTAGMALSGGLGMGGLLGTAGLSTAIALPKKFRRPGEGVGEAAGRMFGETLPYLGATQITTPLISPAVSRIAPTVSPKATKFLAQGLANVAEGLGLAKAFGQKYAPSQAVLDLLTGGAVKPFTGIKAKATVPTKGYARKVAEHSEGIVDVIRRYNKTKSEIGLTEFIEADKTLREDAEFIWKEIFGKNKRPPKNLGQTVGEIWGAWRGAALEKKMRDAGMVLGFAEEKRPTKPRVKMTAEDLLKLQAEQERKRLKFRPKEISEQEAGVLRTRAVIGEEEGVFRSVFDKWIGRRDVARTVGAEYGAKFRDIPKNKAKEFIDHIEGVKKSKDPFIIKRAKEYKQTTDALYQDLKGLAKKAKFNLGYLNRYIFHIWKEDPRTVQKMLSARKRGWGGRKILTYEEGIKLGLTPKYKHPAETLSEYVRRIENVRANLELFEEMKKNGLVVSSAVGMNTPGFSPIIAPGFPRATAGFKGKVFEGNYYAPDSIAKEINRLFQPENLGKTGRVFNVLAKVSRRMQDLILSGGIPKTPINAFTAAQILKEVTSGSIRRPIMALLTSLSPEKSFRYFQENAEQIKKMQARNVIVRTTFDTRGLMGGDSLWNSIISDPTFKRFMPMLQIDLFNQVEKQALRKGLSASKAADIAAEAVKNFYGLTDTAARARRTKIGRDIVTTFAFAPTYREAMINFWVKSLKALGRPLALENRQNLKFLAGAALTYATMNYLNKVLNGHPMSQNPKGKEDKLLIPISDKVTLGIPFLSSIATVPRGLYRVLKRVFELDVKGVAGETLRTFGSVLIKPAGELVLNEDYFGRPIYDEGAKPIERGKQIATYLFRSNQHPYLRAALQPKGTPLYQRLGIATELPVRYYKTSSILNAPFWERYNEAKTLNERLQTLRYKDPKAAVAFYQENKEKIDSYKVLKEQVKAYYESGKNDKVLQDGGVAVTDEHIAFVGSDGKFHLIDTDFEVEPPELTGRPALDKKLISSYKSEINAKKRNVVTLFENGILTADEAEAILQSLDVAYKSVGKAKIPKIKRTKLQLPQLKTTATRPQLLRLSDVTKAISPIKAPAPIRTAPTYPEPLKLRVPKINVSQYGNLRK